MSATWPSGWFRRVTAVLPCSAVSFLFAAALVTVFALGGRPASAAASCTVTWDGGAATTSWSDAANWSTDVVPGSTDVACITDQPGSLTVTYSSTSSIRGVVSFERLSIQGGGSLDLTDSSVLSKSAGLTLNGGTLTGAGSMSVTSSFTWSAGTMQGTGTTTVQAAATLTKSGGALGRVMVTKGTTDVTALGWGFVSGGDWENQGPMTFESITGETRVFGGGLLHNTATGTMTFLGGVQVEAPFENDGTVSVQAGTLRATSGDGAGTTDGPFSVSSGATLELSGSQGSGQSYDLGAASSVGGAGTFALTGGNSTLDGTITVDTFKVTGDARPTLDVDLAVPHLILDGGSAGFLTGPANVSVTGTFNWVSGAMQGTGTTTMQAAATLTKSGGALGRVMVTKGTTDVTALGWGFVSGGDWENQGPMTFESITGETRVFGGGLLHNTATGTMTFLGGVQVEAPFENDGTVSVTASVTYTQAFTSTGTIAISGGTTLEVQGAGLTVSGGTLSGTGTVKGTLTNTGGTVAPGASPGTLSVTGNYSQSSGGRLAVEVAGTAPGTGFDVLAVSGSATLGGTLSITTDAAFTPTAGANFKVLRSTSLSGAFATVQGKSLGGGKYYSVSYASAGVTLQAKPASTISINDVTLNEGTGGNPKATFTVTLSPASELDVTVAYATHDGTAVAPDDYKSASGTLSFPAATTSKTFQVTVVGDDYGDPTETFTADLSNATGATIADPQGLGTITNDDGPVCTILGTDANDVLNGTSGPDVICGRGGGDVLNGLGGDDILKGLAGDDQLNGGLGDDTYDGGTGTDVGGFGDPGATGGVTASLVTGVATGGVGTDTIVVGTVESLSGTTFADQLTGDAIGNTLSGGSGNDTLSGGAGVDALNGGDGDDLMYGGTGGDDFKGGAGTDTVSYMEAVFTSGVVADLPNAIGSGNGATDTIAPGQVENLIGTSFADTLKGDQNPNVLAGGDGDDTIQGNGGVDTIHGDGGGDSIDGGAANDALFGDDSDDTLLGGAGNDAFDGGSGMDTVSFADQPAAVSVDLSTGTVIGTSGSDTIAIGTVENLIGTPFADSLTGDLNANSLDGGVGDDTLKGGPGNDTFADSGTVTDIDTLSFDQSGISSGVTASLATGTVTGGLGNDTFTIGAFENLTGSSLVDVLCGDERANIIKATGGDDTICGGLGDDTLNGGPGTDTVSFDEAVATGGVTASLASSSGGLGHDTMSGMENLTGSPFADSLSGLGSGLPGIVSGRGGNDTLSAGLVGDTLLGGPGDDTLNGGSGPDTVSFDESDAVAGVVASLQTDSAFGGLGNDTFTGTIENLTGSPLNDTLVGDGSANVLSGRDGNDTLTGDAGNDTLKGGSGDDLMLGGPDDDTFDGEAGSDTASFDEPAVTGGVGVDLAAGTASAPGLGSDTFVRVGSISTTENVNGTENPDHISGDDGPNVLDGLGSGDQSLIGRGGDDTLIGSEIGDFLLGGLGNDHLEGGGVATAIYSSSATPVVVDLGAGTATGEGTDTVTGIADVIGSNFNDTLIGDGAANSLSGGAGNDLLKGGLGNDTFDGGTGVDTVSFSETAITAAVTVKLSLGTVTGGAGTDSIVLVSGVSTVEKVKGTGFNDTLAGDSGNNELDGLGGNDKLNVKDGTMSNDIADGGAGLDTCTADSGDIVISC